MINSAYIINAVVFSFLGVFCFAISFYILDRLTPYKLWEEIVVNKNQPLATIVGLSALGICIIVAAAIH